MEQHMLPPVSVWLPNTIEEAWQYKQRFGHAAEFIAGGTLIQLKRENLGIMAPQLISLQHIPHFEEISEDLETSMLLIGAGATLSECLLNSKLKHRAPFLLEAISSIGAPAIRNQGTIGGNVVYGIGDTLTVLLAMDAMVTTYSGQGFVTKLLKEYLSENDSAILTRIHVPFMDQSERSAWYFKKLGRREAFVPSTVTVAIYLKWSEINECEYVRLLVAGGENPPQQLVACEQCLTGTPLNSINFAQLKKQIRDEIRLAGDVFTPESYRLTVATNLLLQGLSEMIDIT